MPSLSDYILNIKVRKPTATVYLDGRKCKLPDTTGAITLNQAFGQPIGGGQIKIIDPPVTPKPGMQIKWNWGYNGQETPAFNGFVTKIVEVSYPHTWTLDVKDTLWLADLVSQQIPVHEPDNIDPDYPWNFKTAKWVIETVLSRYGGITRMAISPLLASGSAWAGSEWVMGTLTPITWSSGTAVAAVSSVCSVLGYWLYCDAGGVVKTIKMTGAPSGGAFRTFKRGVDLLVSSPPQRDEDAEQIRNKVVVSGANTGIEGAQIKDSWQSDHSLLPPKVHREYSFSSPFIEYLNESEAGEASATGCARRMLAEYNRRPATVRAKIKADPRLKVGMTIGIRDAKISHSTAQLYFLYGIQTSFGGGQFDQQIILDGGTGDDGYTLIPPPIPAFTWTLFIETLEGTGGIVEVFLDGSTSQSMNEGEILSWDWAGGAGAIAPTTGTGEKFMIAFPASQGTAEVTLTVMDTTGKTASLTQTINLAGDENTKVIKRGVSFAAGSMWYITPDGGGIWRNEGGGDAVAVPPIGAGGGTDTGTGESAAAASGTIATTGTAGIGVRGTLDQLQTPSEARAVLPGPIRFLWQHEADPLRITAAVGDKIYHSVDGGATFTLNGTPKPGVNINWVVEPVSEESVFEVLAGNQAIWGRGTTWNVVLTGPTGSTAKTYTSGFERHWVGFIDVPSGQSPLLSVEGESILFPAMTPEVTDIRAVTMLVNEPVLYAYDDQGRAWRITSPEGAVTTLTETTGTLPGGTPQHAIRDPEAPVIYVTTNEALKKHLIQTGQIVVFKSVGVGEQGHMAGYMGKPISKGEILLVDNGFAHASPSGVWHYKDGTWTHRTAGLPSINWGGVAADPKNPDRWILWDNEFGQDVWITTDAGLTWSKTDVEANGVHSGLGQSFIADACFSRTATGEWTVSGSDRDSFLASDHMHIWRGSGTSVTAEATAVSNGITTPREHDLITRLTSAMNGETAGLGPSCDTPAYPYAVYKIPMSSALTGYAAITELVNTGGPPAVNPFFTAIDHMPGSSHMLVMSLNGGTGGDGRIAYIIDDREPALAYFNTGLGSSAGTSIAVGSDGVYLGRNWASGSEAQGLTRVTGLPGTPIAINPAEFATTAVIDVRSDRQTQTNVAVALRDNLDRAGPNHNYIALWDTLTWSFIALPGGAGDWSNNYAPRIEVITRET